MNIIKTKSNKIIVKHTIILQITCCCLQETATKLKLLQLHLRPKRNNCSTKFYNCN